MEIRYARPAETEEIAALWCDAFPGRRTVADRVRMLETGGPYGGLETVLVARDAAGRLAGACKIYRMTQHLCGAALAMMGLAAVAVAPHARRRGLGARLCGAALEEARERGDALSTLYPFRPDYYERLGWGLAGRLLRHRFRTAALADHEAGVRVRPARLPDDADAVAACYTRVAARSNGPIARDGRIWGYRLAGEELGVAPLDATAARAGALRRNQRLVVYDHGGVAGYAILRYAPGRSPEENTLHVRELVADSPAAYDGLLAHLAAQRDQWPRALHFARPDERFGDRLSDPRPPGFRAARSLYFPTAGVVRGPMLRVLDAAAVLAARPLFPRGARDRPATLRISVRDRELPGNEGPWRVRWDPARDPRQEVERSGTAGAADAALETDASTFARVVAGDLPPSDAARLGRAVVTGDAALLDHAFAATESFWLLDEF